MTRLEVAVVAVVVEEDVEVRKPTICNFVFMIPSMRAFFIFVFGFMEVTRAFNVC